MIYVRHISVSQLDAFSVKPFSRELILKAGEYAGQYLQNSFSTELVFGSYSNGPFVIRCAYGLKPEYDISPSPENLNSAFGRVIEVK